MTSGEGNRKKVFIPFVDNDARRRLSPHIRLLIKVAFDRGMRAVQNGGELPPSYVAMFGNAAIITEAVKAGAVEDFDYVSAGGALDRRERAILRYLARHHQTIGDTALLRDSVVSSISSVMTLENPAETLSVFDGDPSPIHK